MKYCLVNNAVVYRSERFYISVKGQSRETGTLCDDRIEDEYV